jgi:hypothetical protein
MMMLDAYIKYNVYTCVWYTYNIKEAYTQKFAILKYLENYFINRIINLLQNIKIIFNISYVFNSTISIYIYIYIYID